MAIGRKDALKRLNGLALQVKAHLGKLIANRESRDVPHWKAEVAAWLGQMESLSSHVGKKTGTEWANSIKHWKAQLED